MISGAAFCKTNTPCLNPLSRVNCILMAHEESEASAVFCLNPLSRVNCILILLDRPTKPPSPRLNPLSRVNCILIGGKILLFDKRDLSQSPKSGQLHSNKRGRTASEIASLCLNPLSRVNCILITQSNMHIIATMRGLNPLSRVNCILIHRRIRHFTRHGKSQSPKSGQLHSNIEKDPGHRRYHESLNPLSRVNCILMIGIRKTKNSLTMVSIP